MNTPAAAPKPCILVVDDKRNMRTSLAIMLRDAGYATEEASGGQEAIDVLARQPVDLVITDLKMEPVGGLEVVRQTRVIQPSAEVIVMTAFGTIESAVEAMKAGAVDYVTKPFREEEILIRIEKALERHQLSMEVSLLREEFRKRSGLDRLIGRGPSMREIIARIVKVAPTNTTVLITGESGTGKELVARAIHALSRRKDNPFVAINCAAIAETILESELFGHAKGSFTGASNARKGLFEEANGGTFFFDEAGEIALPVQAKLLRVIQEKQIRRVGENQPIDVDARIIAATNQNLPALIQQKAFREDLYYRLNVVSIHTPPLRERREDIPLLADHFLHVYNLAVGRSLAFGPGTMEHLQRYDYPGNIRELENSVEQAVALADGDELRPADFPFHNPLRRRDTPSGPQPLAAITEHAEKRAIQGALLRHQGSSEEVARELHLSPTTLWRKLKKYGLSAKGAVEPPAGEPPDGEQA